MLPLQFAARIDRYGDIGTLIAVSLGLLAFLTFFDTMIALRPFAPRPFWALLDGLVHGLVAIVVTFPLAAIRPDTKTAILLFVLTFLAATLIDLDHFIAARSLQISDALTLPSRPVTHSLVFALLVSGASYWMLRDPIVSVAVLVALASHILRDASSGGTPILWPLSVQRIPWWSYYVGEVFLLGLSYLVYIGAAAPQPP